MINPRKPEVYPVPVELLTEEPHVIMNVNPDVAAKSRQVHRRTVPFLDNSAYGAFYLGAPEGMISSAYTRNTKTCLPGEGRDMAGLTKISQYSANRIFL
jgi:hypothetical protein